MSNKEFKKMKKRRQEFIDEFIALCEKHELALESDDPYCGLNVVPYDDRMKKYYSNPDSFGRWTYSEIEKRLSE